MSVPTVEIGTDVEHKELDDSGKAVFDCIYDAPDPRLYCHAMASLDYRIPELAKPYFVDMFDRCGRARDRTALNIIDLGASYGVNAALLKWDLSLEQLFGRYTDPDSRSVETMELLNKDRGSVRLKFWAIFNLLMVVKNRRFSAQFMDSLESHFQPNWR